MSIFIQHNADSAPGGAREVLAKVVEKSLVSQRFIEQIQLVSHIVDLHFAVIFRNYLI